MSGTEGQPAATTTTVQQPAVVPATTTPATTTPATTTPIETTAIPAWMQQRLDSMTARMNSAERRAGEAERQRELALTHNTALSQEVANLRSGVAPAPPVPAGHATGGGGQGAAASVRQTDGSDSSPPSSLQEQIDVRARELLQERAQLEEQNASYNRGKALYPDFENTVRQVQNLGGLPPQTLEIALATDAPEHVLYALGKDLNRASEILAMPFGKQAVELAKLALPPAATTTAAAPLSSAPRPLTPVGKAGTSNASFDPTNVSGTSMEAWIEERNKSKQRRTQP